MNTQDERAVEDAKRAGFDLNLIDLNLEVTMEERALRHDGALELALACRKAGATKYAHATPTHSASR